MRAIADVLPNLWPNCPANFMDGILANYDNDTAEFAINSDRRHLHFLTQISAETEGGTVLVESMSFKSAARLRQVWPARFRAMSDEDIEANYVRQPEALGNFVYGSRMGNEDDGTDDNDGYDHRGQGLLQSTGKAAHRAIGEACGLDLVGNPGLMIAPDTALRVAACDFAVICKTLQWCDANSLRNVSALVNVGHIVSNPSAIVGWDNRVRWFNKVRVAL